jgi:protein TonB
MFNSASSRAALKLKYKPKIVDGKAVAVDDVLHRFTFILAEDD